MIINKFNPIQILLLLKRHLELILNPKNFKIRDKLQNKIQSKLQNKMVKILNITMIKTNKTNNLMNMNDMLINLRQVLLDKEKLKV